MSHYDVLVRGGTVVTSEAVSLADIAIADGRIAVCAPEIEGDVAEEIDARGLHIFPGVIDTHVHFNEPGRSEWEGFATGTRALAAGGATAYVEMPLNAHPPTVDAASFDLKLDAAKTSSQVDFAFWGGLVPGGIEQMDELAERGVVGFKAFLSNSGIEDFPAVDDLTLYEGMRRAATLGRIVAVHAENDGITSALALRARREGRTGVRDYLASRPAIAEVEAISRSILLAEETRCALHIVHVSTGRGVALVTAARQRGIDVTCETCPHYLALTDEDVEQIGAIAKCAPPIRSATEQTALWECLMAGDIPIVASDHSPSPPEMKVEPDFFAVWGGISGCQTLLRVLLTAGWEQRQAPLTALAAVTSANPALRYGFASMKGTIAPGVDADLALVDLSRSDVLHSSDLLYRHQHSPFVGRRLRGQIVRTLLRGATIFRDGVIVSPARGRLLRPGYTERERGR